MSSLGEKNSKIMFGGLSPDTTKDDIAAFFRSAKSIKIDQRNRNKQYMYVSYYFCSLIFI